MNPFNTLIRQIFRNDKHRGSKGGASGTLVQPESLYALIFGLRAIKLAVPVKAAPPMALDPPRNKRAVQKCCHGYMDLYESSCHLINDH